MAECFVPSLPVPIPLSTVALPFTSGPPLGPYGVQYGREDTDSLVVTRVDGVRRSSGGGRCVRGEDVSEVEGSRVNYSVTHPRYKYVDTNKACLHVPTITHYSYIHNNPGNDKYFILKLLCIIIIEG